MCIYWLSRNTFETVGTDIWWPKKVRRIFARRFCSLRAFFPWIKARKTLELEAESAGRGEQPQSCWGGAGQGCCVGSAEPKGFTGVHACMNKMHLYLIVCLRQPCGSSLFDDIWKYVCRCWSQQWCFWSWLLVWNRPPHLLTSRSCACRCESHSVQQPFLRPAAQSSPNSLAPSS